MEQISEERARQLDEWVRDEFVRTVGFVPPTQGEITQWLAQRIRFLESQRTDLIELLQSCLRRLEAIESQSGSSPEEPAPQKSSGPPRTDAVEFEP